MKLYLLEQTSNKDWDTYDSCIVCAESEEDAKTIHPRGNEFKEHQQWNGWVQTKDQISCTEIGVANEDIKKGVICASFNAG